MNYEVQWRMIDSTYSRFSSNYRSRFATKLEEEELVATLTLNFIVNNFLVSHVQSLVIGSVLQIEFLLEKTSDVSVICMI